jgi:hypothetical protein
MRRSRLASLARGFKGELDTELGEARIDPGVEVLPCRYLRTHESTARATRRASGQLMTMPPPPP